MQETDKTPRKRGQPAFKPTKTQRNLVTLYVAGGIAEPGIAAELGICQNTLRKHFAVELRDGNRMELAANLQRLRKAADKGNVTAMKYLNDKFGLLPPPPPPKPTAPVVREPPLGKKKQAELDAKKAPDSADWSSILQ